LKWIGPSTEDEVLRAGRDKVPVVIAPIAFVSDHSETLVEIDIEYRHLAQQSGVPHFAFVPAVGTAPDFIRGLACLIRAPEKDCVCLKQGLEVEE
jgi:ferrochelatase